MPISFSFGWLAAGTLCALALISSLFMKSKPADIGQFPDGIDTEGASDAAGSLTAGKARTYRTSETWTLREVLRQPVLYLLGLCMLAQMSAIYLLTTHGVLHLTDAGFTSMQAASALGNLILFSGFARFPIGFVGDRIEPRWIMAAALTGMGAAGIIYDRFDSYDIAFIYVVIFTFVTALLATALVPPKKTKTS